MFEQIVNLITRGVVALETIAKHYETVGAAVGKQEDKKPSKAKKEVVEDDDDEAEDEKPAKTKKAPAKGKGKKDADPLAEMRDEIKQYAAIIAGGDDDDVVAHPQRAEQRLRLGHLRAGRIGDERRAMEADPESFRVLQRALDAVTVRRDERHHVRGRVPLLGALPVLARIHG